jgi:hypothetical protein
MKTTLVEDLKYFAVSYHHAHEMVLEAGRKFNIASRDCPHKSRKPSDDWHTCTHRHNPTVIGSCSIIHCPLRKGS